MSQVLVRPAASAEDWAFIRELCCRTGNGGAPIDSGRWAFFAEFWIGPYQRLLPEWTYVAEHEGRRVGYLTGCPDTRSFYLKRDLLFFAPLLLKTVLGSYPKNSDTRRFIRRFLRLDRGPEERFPRAAIQRMRREYPAHLHMNVESDVRKAGVGRKLLEVYRQDLQNHRTRLGFQKGLHLFCGEGPIPFYQRTGFQELERIEFVKGVWVYALGCKI